MSDQGSLIDIFEGPFGDRLREARDRVNKQKEEMGMEAWEAMKAEERRQKDAEDNIKLIRERSERLLEKSGLKDEITRFTFDNFIAQEDWQREMKEMCERFRDGFLYISGQPGCGKTHLGTAVCARLIQSGVLTVYTTFDRMMDEFRQTVNDDEYDDVFDKYSDAKALYIDDFMKFEPTKADIKHSFKLLNLRMIQRKTTIITSERSLNEIIRIDEALGSRIKQMCGEYCMNIGRKDGRNWRLK